MKTLYEIGFTEIFNDLTKPAKANEAAFDEVRKGRKISWSYDIFTVDSSVETGS
jgi:hypothetical protein